MSHLGTIIRLKGITQKGKNRIREHGDMWVVLAETERVLFRPDVAGPWLFIAPEGQTQENRGSRWIKATDDPDFQIVA